MDTTIPAAMRAWVASASRPGTVEPAVLPVPVPAGDELLVRVAVCGVCRTDLHVRDGDLPAHRTRVVPGHETVGEVVAAGPDATGPAAGTRVGIPWLRRTCGTCAFCGRGQENLCPSSRYTGWDADGGYAEYTTVPAAYAYELPQGYAEEELAPLLCAGIIGYRALRRADLPPGGHLGIYGYGASAHLTAQIALAQGASVHVFTRSPAARDLALRALGSGGTLSIAGIHLSAIPPLDYRRDLFRERTVRSVTANTRADGRALFAVAAAQPLRVMVTPYAFDRADRALDDLAAGRVNGVAVLRVRPAGC